MEKLPVSTTNKLNMTGHRRYSRRTSAALLLTLAWTPLTSGRRVIQRARGGRRMELKKLDVEFFDDLEYQRQKPGLVFFEDGEGLEEFAAYDWTREGTATTRNIDADTNTYRTTDNGDEWHWRSKGKGKSGKGDDCPGDSSNDDGKGKGGKSKSKNSPTVSVMPSPSPSVSNAPSQSSAPTTGPSLSTEPTTSPTTGPTLSQAPSGSPSQSLAPSAGPTVSAPPTDLPSVGPSLSLVPSGMPSLSFQPSISNRPSAAPSVSVRPSVSFSPTPKSTKAPSLKSAKSSKSPTLGSKKASKSPTIKSTKSPTLKSTRCTPSAAPADMDDTAAPSTSSAPSPSPSTSSAPSPSPSTSSAPSVSLAPSTSSAPSSIPSVSLQPSVSVSPAVMNPTVSELPSISENPSAVPTIVPTASSDSKGSSSKGSPDVLSLDSPDGDTCNNIEAMTRPDGFTIDSEFTVRIPVGFDDEKFNLADVIAALNTLRIPVALWVAGCEEEAEEFLRRLMDDNVEYAEMTQWTQDTDVDCTPPTGGECGTFETDIMVDVNGDVSDETLEARIQRAFEIFQDLILSYDGILSFPVGDMTIEDPNNTSGAQDGSNAVPAGIAAGTTVGIVAAGLAFLLLLILLIRRRREEDEPSHFKLDDEGNEATFIREFETEPSSDGGSPYKTRNIHVIGEADSVISGWTGYTRDLNNSFEDDGGIPGKLGHAHGDVHMCSSATCEVCELRRQNGVQFQPTDRPNRSHLPADASREYLADDTVEL